MLELFICTGGDIYQNKHVDDLFQLGFVKIEEARRANPRHLIPLQSSRHLGRGALININAGIEQKCRLNSEEESASSLKLMSYGLASQNKPHLSILACTPHCF